MSADMIFRQELGIVFDTINVLKMKLNEKNLWINYVVQKDTETEDVNYIDFWLNQFDEIPKELMIFFYLKDQRSSGFFSPVFLKLIQNAKGNLSYQDVLSYIDNTEKIRNDISEFYLGVQVSDIQEFAEELRKKTDMDGLLRFYLMDFMTNSDHYLGLFKEVFASCYEKTVALHNEKALTIIKWQETVKREKLYNLSARYYSKEVVEKNILQGDNLVVYSMSLFIRNSVMFEIEKEYRWFILGIDYQKQVIEDAEIVIDVAALGNAFGDKHRFNIIKLILQHGELTVSDIANRLGLAVNSVSYHLDIMRKANLLRNRSKGKSTVYWLNTKVCSIISTMLDDWSKGGTGIETSMEKAYSYHVKSKDNE